MLLAIALNVHICMKRTRAHTHTHTHTHTHKPLTTPPFPGTARYWQDSHPPSFDLCSAGHHSRTTCTCGHGSAASMCRHKCSSRQFGARLGCAWSACRESGQPCKGRDCCLCLRWGPLLACADTNAAAENLVQVLVARGVHVVWVGNPAKVGTAVFYSDWMLIFM